MHNLFKIAIRNLRRYKRRTLLTASLITIGVIFVLVFVSVTGSFKSMMISQITDSMLGHIQVHRAGYVASIDNLPLNLNLKPQAIKRVESAINEIKEIEAYSPRIKFGGLFSNFTETTNIRLNGVIPEKEFQTVPLLPARITVGEKSLKTGEILIPDLLSKGMGVKVGGTIVVIATNKDGSVNGKQFIVRGILESATGPGGRDGYIHMNDAIELLRMEEPEISEIGIRLKNFGKLNEVDARLERILSGETHKQGKSAFEVHTWEKLSPFYTIARMIDMMTLSIKLMLIAIVLISIMNVMVMSVFERVREIGTIAAIGTLPGKILSMFIIEGFCLGLIGTFTGGMFGTVIVYILYLVKFTFSFGLQKGLVLQPTVQVGDVLILSAIVIVVSVIASLQPALKASRMEPIKALRSV